MSQQDDEKELYNFIKQCEEQEEVEAKYQLEMTFNMFYELAENVIDFLKEISVEEEKIKTEYYVHTVWDFMTLYYNDKCQKDDADTVYNMVKARVCISKQIEKICEGLENYNVESLVYWSLEEAHNVGSTLEGIFAPSKFEPELKNEMEAFKDFLERYVIFRASRSAWPVPPQDDYVLEIYDRMLANCCYEYVDLSEAEDGNELQNIIDVVEEVINDWKYATSTDVFYAMSKLLNPGEFTRVNPKYYYPLELIEKSLVYNVCQKYDVPYIDFQIIRPDRDLVDEIPF